jgi:DNA-binding NtrC family response regulator
LVLDDPEVSALHCEVRATVSGVVLRDLGSTNGTFIGTLAVSEARLMGPCFIRVGQTDVVFEPTGRTKVEHAEELSSFGPLVGTSPMMQQLYETLQKVSPTELSVLITGETGTGKELVAQAIHEASPRKEGPFVVLDCGAIPSSLAESILFGHERGSFTGAVEKRVGVLQQASGGTLFLDELGELPEELQPKLLRALAERSIRTVGGTKYIPIDVRVVAATRRDLRLEMNAARFRSDLYFRIAQMRIEVPSLRERRQDLPALVQRACERMGRSNIAEKCVRHIEARFRYYDWPGNVRELMNVSSVLAALSGDGGEVELAMLPVEGEDPGGAASAGVDGGNGSQKFSVAKREFEREYFHRLQRETDNNISAISRICGLARHQVRDHLRKLGLMES